VKLGFAERRRSNELRTQVNVLRCRAALFKGMHHLKHVPGKFAAGSVRATIADRDRHIENANSARVTVEAM
jgi:hypothetical protein